MFTCGGESEFKVVLVITYLLIWNQPDRKDGENEKNDNNSKNFHKLNLGPKIVKFGNSTECFF
jgi:hypothetical protein